MLFFLANFGISISILFKLYKKIFSDNEKNNGMRIAKYAYAVMHFARILANFAKFIFQANNFEKLVLKISIWCFVNDLSFIRKFYLRNFDKNLLICPCKHFVWRMFLIQHVEYTQEQHVDHSKTTCCNVDKIKTEYTVEMFSIISYCLIFMWIFKMYDTYLCLNIFI